MIPRLIVASGKHRGREIPIEEDIIILGTAKGCDIRFKGENVASKHCQMSKLGATLVLHNLVAADRTLLNGKPVTQADLSHGDTLSVGGTLFRVALSDEPLPAPGDESVSEELSRASEIPEDEETTAFFAPYRGGEAPEPAPTPVGRAAPVEIIMAPSYQVELVRIMIDDMERDIPFYQGHSAAVAQVAAALARRLHLHETDVEAAYMAGLLHDSGQDAIPSEILRKKGPLSPDERLLVERHPVLAASKLQVKGIPFAVYSTVLNHHEQPDGQGYPVGIRRGAVDVLARVLHTAEVYTALLSDRPCREAFDPKAALHEIRRSGSGEFSVDCLDALETLTGSDALSGVFSELQAARGGRTQ